MAETSIYYFNYLKKTLTKEISSNFVKFRPNSQRRHHQLFYLVGPLFATLLECMCKCYEEIFLKKKKEPKLNGAETLLVDFYYWHVYDLVI